MTDAPRPDASTSPPASSGGAAEAAAPAAQAGVWDQWAQGHTTALTAPATGLPSEPGTAPGAPPAPLDGGRPSDRGAAAVLWPAPPPNASPRWARWAVAALLVATALIYLWGLSRNGWANAYYSAAAQAGGESWKAWFFGSFDAANAITVDKPPASLWLMGLSVRLLGLSTWSVLAPQALLGVASVGVLHATVRRWFGAPAGLIAGAVLALTPVAALMFRFNNPDALLVFLLVCAAWAMGRATERGSLRWIALAGALVGFAFLAKMMQAFLVLPGFVAMYALAAPIDLRRRIGHLLAAFAAMVVAGGWWVAIVELWPASSRPYIGGSQTNSIVELILGYNGFGRLTGDEVGSVGGGGGQAGRWGATGWDRLFSASYGGQVAWLLPAALAMIVILIWISRRSARTDLTRAAVLGWGGWLIVTAAVISFSQGIIHEYYTVALAPAIGALVGIGSAALWAHREQLWARVASAALIAGTAWWSAVLLGRSAQFLPWLRPLVLVGGLVAAGAVLAAPRLHELPGRRVALTAGVAGLIVALAGPTAYSLETASTSASGSLPSAGPTVAGARGGPGGGAHGGGRGDG
ncbi:MAG: glycosyltransferase family 39 protein, partial [Candidatus Nanopelagicales bacterium]